MALTENSYIGDGYETLFPFTFEYILPEDVKAEVNGVDTTEYYLANPTTVKFNVAPAQGVFVRIYRQTTTATVPTTFYSGSTITAKGLNDNFNQTLFVSQEVQRAQEEAIASNDLSEEALEKANEALVESSVAKAAAQAAAADAETAKRDAQLASADANQAAEDAAAAQTSAVLAEEAAQDAQDAVDAIGSDSAEAVSKAEQALATANTADANASTALSQSATAVADASEALETANAADDLATQASIDAAGALLAVSSVTTYDPIPNVGAIPADPADGQGERIIDSTGIESVPDLAGLPVGFVGSSGTSVDIIYTAGGWNWVATSVPDPDARYVNVDGSGDVTVLGSATFTGDIQTGGDANGGAADGARLRSVGLLQVSRSTGSSAIWTGYTTGQSSNTSRINADGSATFAGDVNVDGNLGVGTNSPNYLVHAVGENNPIIAVEDSTNNTQTILRALNEVGYVGTQSNHPVYVISHGTAALTIDTSQNVGIGTPDPDVKLDVRGNEVVARIGNVDEYTQFGTFGAGASERPFMRLTDGAGSWQAQIGGRSADGTETANYFLNSVGLGTTNPVRRLQLGDNTASTEVISLQTNTTGSGSIYFGDNTSTTAECAGILRYSHSDDSMQFWTASNERMRIDSSGRLLVGTSSSSDARDITKILVSHGGAGADQNVGHVISCYASNDASSGFIDFNKSNSATQGTHALVGSDNLGQINFRGSDGAKFVAAASIKGESDGTAGTDDMPGRLVFSTTADGASSPTERMRITSDGKVGIGTTNAVDNLTVYGTDPAVSIFADSPTGRSDLFFRSLNGAQGRIRYEHSDDSMSFFTAGSEVLTLNADASASFAGDIEVTTASKGVILKSPNGTRYRLTVADDGTLSTAAV